MLSDRLQSLEAADLIRRAQAAPELEYFFRHALVQDAAYHSLLRNSRRELHLNVARLLEQQGESWSAEHAALLAHHFQEGGDDERALHYLAQAGDAAAQRHANAEAILNYTSALEIATRADNPADYLAGLFRRRGRAMELSGQYGAALANYATMAERARAGSDRAGELSARLSTATLFAVPNPEYDPSRAEALALQVVADAQAIGEKTIECRALWILMVLCIYGSREPQLGVSYGLQALDLARSLGLQEQLAYVLTDLYLAEFAAGKIGEALPGLREARVLWNDLHNLPMLADCVARIGHYHFCAGELDRCIAISQEALQVSRAAHNLWQEASSQQVAVSAYLEEGRIGEAMTILRRMIAAADEGGVVPSQVGGRAVLGMTLAWLGDVEQGIVLAEAALRSAERMPPMRAWALAALVRIKLFQGDLAGADALAIELASGYAPLRRGLSVLVPAWVDTAEAMVEVALAHEQYERALADAGELCESLAVLGVRPFAYEALYLKAMALRGLGQDGAAATTLSEARAAAEMIGARRALWHIHAALGAEKRRNGDEAGARAEYAAAREQIEFIAAGLTDAGVQRSFLQTPAVRSVLERA